MRGVKGLQFVSVFFLITHFSLINSLAQTALLTTPGSDSVNNSTTSDKDIPAASTASPKEESITSAFTPLPALIPSALSSRDPQKFGLIDLAYLDAFTILLDDNQCSRFFGGRYAVSALTELVRILKPRYLDQNIAIRMSGDITTFQSQATGFTFRMFKNAEVNLSGSFFRTNHRGSVSSVYLPNTRETRVVVLLHELGHLVKTPDKRWVLADDGKDLGISLDNTEKVVSACREQIDSLSKLSLAQELELAMSERVASLSPIKEHF